MSPKMRCHPERSSGFAQQSDYAQDDKTLVPEVPYTRENHGQTQPVCGFNDLLVAN